MSFSLTEILRPDAFPRALFLTLPLVFVLAMTNLAGSAFGKKDRQPAEYGSIDISTRMISYFQGDDHDRRIFGRLKWRGGLTVRSTSPFFGGISGLVMGPQGKYLLAVTDRGSWVRAEVLYEGEALHGLRNVTIGPLRARDGRPLDRKRHQDAEGVALLRGTPLKGELLISFERNHRIGRFPVNAKGVLKPLNYLKLPSLRGVTRNKGLEALTIIRAGRYKGRVLTFAERKKNDAGHLEGWILTRRGARRLQLVRLDGFDITDLASLPSGEIIVLERRFRWSEGVQMRLRLLSLSDLRSDKPILGQTLLQVDGGFTIDNMEGVSVHKSSDGKTIITLVSDDNFSVLQRTLLLQFELMKKRPVEAGR